MSELKVKAYQNALACSGCATPIETTEYTEKDGKASLVYECPKCKNKYRMGITLGKPVLMAKPKPNPTKQQTKVFAKVSGVTFANTDGTKRQDILKHVKAGDSLTIEEGTFKEGTVTLLRHELGIIGILRAEYLSDYKALYPNTPPKASVVRVTGGTGDKESMGCNVLLEPDDKDGTATPRPSVVYLGPDNLLFHVERHCSGLSETTAVDILHDKASLHGAKACKRCAAKLFPEFA